jgi:hypothetical protein
MSEQIVLSTNTVIKGVWFAAGKPLPYKTAAEVPLSLQPFVVSESEEPDESEERLLNFAPNVVYTSSADGSRSRGRAVARQAAALERAISEQELAEQEANAIDEQTAAALAIVQEQHDVDVTIQIKQLEIAARDRDSAPALINEQREEEEAAIEWKPEPKPPRRKQK